MMNEEMITKAKEANSVEELITLAKENGIELNEEDAIMYFEQLNAKKGELSDDELSDVSGGGCETKVDGKKYTVVTSHCKCFTGQYLCNIASNAMWEERFSIRFDNYDIRTTWYRHSGNNGGQEVKGSNTCGSCAHLAFKDGLGYCEKS